MRKARIELRHAHRAALSWQVAAVRVPGSGSRKDASTSAQICSYTVLRFFLWLLRGHNGRNCGRCHLCPPGSLKREPGNRDRDRDRALLGIAKLEPWLDVSFQVNREGCPEPCTVKEDGVLTSWTGDPRWNGA